MGALRFSAPKTAIISILARLQLHPGILEEKLPREEVRKDRWRPTESAFKTVDSMLKPIVYFKTFARRYVL